MMNENVNDFIWEMTALIIFVFGLTVFFSMNNGINEHLDLYQNAFGRSILMTDDELATDLVMKKELVAMLYHGINSDISIDGMDYLKGTQISDFSAIKDGEYEVERIINSQGEIVKLEFKSR